MPAIVIAIEVSEVGLSAAREDADAFLSHLEAQPGPRAATSWLVIRRLVQQLNAATEARAQQARDARPRPMSIREERRKLAA